MARELTPRRRIWEAAQRVTLGKILPKDELAAIVLQHETEMSKVWYGSGEKDFSFYSDPNYVYLLLNSWSVRSGQDTDFLLRNGLFVPDPDAIFDFHGGMGLTAMRLAMAYPKATVISHSAVQQHRDWCRDIAKELGLSNVVAVDELVKADILIAQETMEHFQWPFTEMTRMLDSVRPRQYLDGTSFSIDSPGHFTTFLDLNVTEDGAEEVAVPKKSAKRRLFKLLKSRGFQLYWERRPEHKKPFNGRPALFDGPG